MNLKIIHSQQKLTRINRRTRRTSTMDSTKTATTPTAAAAAGTTIGATPMDSEVRPLSWYANELEVCKRELEAYKTLYWDLQVELDRVDEMRKKSVRYFALRRQKALERLFDRNDSDTDCECDCNGEDEVDR